MARSRHLNRMELFKDVVDHGSFSAAARNKGVTPSLVSQAISQMETDLGVKLLNRSTRKIWLTDAGRLFYEGSSNVILEADRALSRIRQLEGLPSGTLRVTAESEFGVRFLVPVVSNFRRTYPGVSVDMILTDQVMDMSEYGIDIALRGGINRNAQETGIKLADIPLLVCGAPAYLNSRGIPKTPADLKDHAWINHRTFGVPRRLRFEGPNRKEVEVDVQGSISVNTVQAILGFVRQSSGLIVMPECYVEDDLHSGALVRVLDEWHLPSVPIYAVHQSQEDPPEKVSAFIEFLKESNLLGPWASQIQAAIIENQP